MSGADRTPLSFTSGNHDIKVKGLSDNLTGTRAHLNSVY